MNIHFFSEDIDFVPEDEEAIQNWIMQVVTYEKKEILELNYIFCSDQYLHQINLEYLHHDTYTDIITFDNSEEENIIEGDIFISIERVKENAASYQVSFQHELLRVIIHGVLHLIGFGDKTPEQKKQMRGKEDTYLSLYNF